MHTIPRFFLKQTVIIALSLASLPAEAACYVTCRCSDRHVSGSERQGPFNSTAACNAAVNSMSMRCRSGGGALVPYCDPCMNCDPQPAPRPAAPSGAVAPTAQQSDLEEKWKAQKAAEQRQFQADKDNLMKQIKGGGIGGANEIKLKSPPSSSAMHQLDCAREQSVTGGIESHGKDWTYSSKCKPVRPEVPPVPSPVPAEVKGRIPQVQLDLQQRITTVRQQLTHHDSEIVRLEQAAQAEELKKPELKKDAPAGDSDVLRKAREALAKAKAERERTAAELSKLEKQEVAGQPSASGARH